MIIRWMDHWNAVWVPVYRAVSILFAVAVFWGHVDESDLNPSTKYKDLHLFENDSMHTDLHAVVMLCNCNLCSCSLFSDRVCPYSIMWG